ncbi:hypothetical protein ACPUGT_17115, partial [Klebsiella aerogenes]|uniref:hypothetical protein n=1 Tax=Klebsiella aerogenes TaxID=548 RepID=UPI003D3433B9
MTNNQLTPENVTRYAKYGVDMIEWPDGGYVRYEDYAALAVELQERRKADSEPAMYVMGMGRALDAETASTCKSAVDSWV